MYTALILILIAASVYLLSSGFKKRKRTKIVGGFALIIFTIYFFWFMGFWAETLWFQMLGYGQRFWTVVYSNVILTAAGGAFGWLLVFLLLIRLPKDRKLVRSATPLVGLFIGALWGLSNWQSILQFIYSIKTAVTEPIFGLNTGFYLFTLPFLDKLFGLLIVLTLISLIASFIPIFIRYSINGIMLKFPSANDYSIAKYYNSLYLNSAVFLIVLAFGRLLAKYHLMYSEKGVVSGPGWTDVNVLVPAYNILVIIMLLVALVLLIPFLRNKFLKIFNKIRILAGSPFPLLISSAAIVILFWFLGLALIPGLFESLMVQPNEITYEKPYISNNIKFTRYGFGLNQIEEHEFPENGSFTPETVQNNLSIFQNVRLWDWRALDAVYRQFQEIRLYYQFSDVDVDRYHFGNNYRQVMVSGREMNLQNLPIKSQTFVNKRFQYTHGYGITMATVNEFTPQGLPHLLIKDIPPKSEFSSLDVKQPQIYYGELTNTPVIVNSKEKEFDYPSGDDNVYNRYQGKGGVRISNFWRKFLFGWKFDGTKFLFSDYPTDSSRIMFHRQIKERVQELAPFLNFDKDPYIVLANGKLYWIIDAYTTSEYYPYSEPFNSAESIDFKEGNIDKKLVTRVGEHLNGINYIRNSVKAVVNAYDGSVDFYIVDNNDPVIKVWKRIFPGLLKSKDQMPKALFSHIRYPIDMLLVQGLVFEKYHMSDPTVFYNQEDLWVRATEKYYNQVQPVEPYYIMWQLPGSQKPQFALIMPFTPKNRQVLIGWIAGLCDGDNYGKFLAYQFPKDKMVLGPQQVETKIDQDSFLSGQLTLWDQRGSNVIRGNVLAIPVNNTLFYVEPIYLQAETAAYPELRLVVVMHGDDMSYGESFDKALAGIFSKNNTKIPNISETGTTKSSSQPSQNFSTGEKINAANNAFNNYLKLNSQKKFSEAAKELEKLQNLLNELSNEKSSKK